MSLPIPNSSGAPVDPKQLQAMDAPLIALTQQCGGDLRRLMFAFFSFLHRRTDFYLVPHPDDEASTMGFREGDAEKLLVAAFRQFPLRRIPKGGTPQESTPAGSTSVEPKADAKKRLEVKSKAQAPTHPETAQPSSEDATTTKETKKPTTAERKVETKNDQVKNSSRDPMADVNYTEEGYQVPVGNGGSTKTYKWTQTLEECSVLVGVPKTLRGKDLTVEITANKLCVKSKKPLEGEDTPRTFVEGNLVAKVRPDESTWSVEGGVVIVILDKTQHTFWKSILQGDEEIDTELVDNRRHVGEYDDATQAQIRKIIFDQEQYHKGGPTSDEILGQKSGIPALPSGVEYIDKKKVDEVENKQKTEKS